MDWPRGFKIGTKKVTCIHPGPFRPRVSTFLFAPATKTRHCAWELAWWDFEPRSAAGARYTLPQSDFEPGEMQLVS